MKRSFEPIDLAIAVGVFATVLGGYLMFMASSATVQGMATEPMSIERTATVADAMEWVQPALGQSIVEDIILERDMAKDMTREVRRLNRVSLADQALGSVPFGFVDRVRGYATAVEDDHVARMQWVMGRAIVNSTARGIRIGLLSPHNMNGSFNRALIGRALFLGAQIDEAFRSGWQERLGQMIVVSTQDYSKIRGETQQQLGRSIVALTKIQDRYGEKQGLLQAQLAAASIAAVHGEQIADRFAQLAASDMGTKRISSSMMEPYSLPEVSAGVLVLACMALIGIFVAGLVLPRREPMPEFQEAEYALSEEQYRKTA